MADCEHHPNSLERGPRVFMRWGTSETEQCQECGAWRTIAHVPGPWQPEDLLAWVAAKPIDEET